MKAMYLREEKIKRRTTIQSLKGENGQFIKLHVIKDEIRKDSTKKGVLASWEGMADWTSMMGSSCALFSGGRGPGSMEA